VVTSDKLQTQFRQFGDIQEMDYRVDLDSGASLSVCRIKYKINSKDMLSGHSSAKKAVQEAAKIKIGGSTVQVEFDHDGLKTVRKVGEAQSKRHAEQAAEALAREQQNAPKDHTPVLPKTIPTGPAADKTKSSPASSLAAKNATPPSAQHLEHPRFNSDPRRSIDPRTPLNESARSRRTSMSPPRGRNLSGTDSKYRGRQDRSRSSTRSPSRGRSRSRERDDHHRRRSRSPSRTPSRSRRRDEDRRRRSVSPDRDDYHRRRSPSPDSRRSRGRRSPSPDRRHSDDRRRTAPDEYRPPYSSRFRRGIDDVDHVRGSKYYRDLTPSPSSSRKSPPPSDDERGRPRHRQDHSLSISRSPSDQRRYSNRDRGRQRDQSYDSPSRSRETLRLSSIMTNKLDGRPYVFVSDRDLPVRQFSARDLGLCFKTYHCSVRPSNIVLMVGI
jgi:hypothetical protein